MARRNQQRDHVTGQFEYGFGGMDRMCVCGHVLGAHVAGGWDCLNGNAAVGPECDGTPCDCRKFRQSRAKRHRPTTPADARAEKTV